MKFDSIALLDQLIQESLFVSLHNGLVNEQAVKSAIIIDPGTLAQQERRKNKYPGSIRSFKVKAKSSSEAAIINNIKSNTDFGDNSRYANGDYIYMLGAPIRESSIGNTKTYLVLIYPKTHEQFSYMPDSPVFIEIHNSVARLQNRLNPTGGTVRTPTLPESIGSSSILTASYIKQRLKAITELEAELESLQQQSEITNKQQTKISELETQLRSVQDQLASTQNQVATQLDATTVKRDDVATLEGAIDVAPERIKDAIWQDEEDGQIKLAVDQNTDYLITLDNNVYKVETSTGTINLADYE
jgi:cob(I)alamin adenosyltransferase